MFASYFILFLSHLYEEHFYKLNFGTNLIVRGHNFVGAVFILSHATLLPGFLRFLSGRFFGVVYRSAFLPGWVHFFFSSLVLSGDTEVPETPAEVQRGSSAAAFPFLPFCCRCCCRCRALGLSFGFFSLPSCLLSIFSYSFSEPSVCYPTCSIAFQPACF